MEVYDTFWIAIKESDVIEALLCLSNMAWCKNWIKSITSSTDTLLKIIEATSVYSNSNTLSEAVITLANIVMHKDTYIIDLLVKSNMIAGLIRILKINSNAKLKHRTLTLLKWLFELKRKSSINDNEYAYEFHINNGEEVLEDLALNEKNNRVLEMCENLLDYYFRESSL